MSKKSIYSISLAILDFGIFFVICILSFLLVTGQGSLPLNFIITALSVSAGKVFFSILFKNYNLLWMYSIRRNLVKLLLLTIGLDMLLLCLSWITAVTDATGFRASIYFVVMLMEFCYLVISRFSLTIYLTKFYKRKKNLNVEPVRTLIVGAGNAGAMVLNELGKKEFGHHIVGFADDSKDKIGTYISNVKVYGPVEKINEISKKLRIQKIIIAMPSAGISRIKEVVNEINYKDVVVEMLPDKSKLLQSDLKTNIRKVEIADLLGRTPIQLDQSGLLKFIRGKVILVTGGGGSIGSEIVRQLLQYQPRLVIIFDIYENSVYELKTSLDMIYDTKMLRDRYICLIGSVRDPKRLDEIFEQYHPNLIFHAAAHKHVPLMEDSPKEAVKNNVVGTYNVARIAEKYKAEKMVLISTDKAVNPTNVMGATKRFCEMIVETWDQMAKETSYSMVRFGNVLGSNGSVIPLFRKQIENGGPVTVTSDEINRFFMTIPEACGLVIQSAAYAKGGEKFILDMGQPVKIIDLAKNMIKLSGLELGKDIEIEITGLRPGEKLYEELILNTATASKTENDKIFVEYCDNPLPLSKVEEFIANLLNLGDDNKTVINYLKDVEKSKAHLKEE